MHQVRGRAVDADHAGVRLARDRVGGQARAVGDVDHVHLLARHEVRGLHEGRVDRDRAHVVKVRLSHRGAVDLGDHHGPLQRLESHGAPPALSGVGRALAGANAGHHVVDETRVAHLGGDRDHHISTVVARRGAARTPGPSRRCSRAPRPGTWATAARATVSASDSGPPSSSTCSASASARDSTSASARSASDRCALRLDSARPSVVPHGGHHRDLDGHVEVPAHRADGDHLLRVLLAEERHVGPGEVQQLEQPQSARRQSGPADAAPSNTSLIAPADTVTIGSPPGYTSSTVGRVDDVHAQRLEQRGVGVQVARVPLKVRRVVELERVHEHGDDHLIGGLARGTHQGKVALMQARPWSSRRRVGPGFLPRRAGSISANSAAVRTMSMSVVSQRCDDRGIVGGADASRRQAQGRRWSAPSHGTPGRPRDARRAPPRARRRCPRRPSPPGPSGSTARPALPRARPRRRRAPEGPSSLPGSSIPAAASSDDACDTSVTTWFAPCTSAAW